MTVEPLGWIARLTIGEIILWVGAIVAFVTLIRKIGKPIKRLVDGLESITRDWHGVPERRDAAGMLIEPGRPGIMAQVEVLRSQVQNSHSSNLREDLDIVRDLVKGLAEQQVVLSEKLDEHIDIAKESDLNQVRLAEQLEEFTPVMKQLQEQYVPPDELSAKLS